MALQEMVSVEDLVKVYPGGVRALAGVSFAVEAGEFFGFLGPNGAGKSTTLKILGTLLRKTSGRVLVAGHDPDRDPRAVRRSVGFAMQDVGLDDLSSGRDFLVLQGILYGLSRRDARSRADDLLDLVGLVSVAHRKVGTYSGGMRRRIDLMGALMHSPPLLFLDEPTTGLDPQSRLAIWDHLIQLNRQGVTIILTSQMMDEVDRLCQRIAIVDQGAIVALDSPRALKAQVGGDVVHVTFKGDSAPERQAHSERALALVAAREDVEAVTEVEGGLAFQVRNGGAAAPDLLRLLHESEVLVDSLSLASPTLDDVFLSYTGRSIRSEETSGDEGAQAMRPLLGVRRR